MYPLWLKLQRGQKADPNNVGCHRVVEAARLPVIENLVNAGANGYLMKDDALSTNLVTAVRTVYIGGACFSPEVTRAIMERRRERPQPDVLTEREKEILAHAIRYADSDNTVIASALGITTNTDAVLGGGRRSRLSVVRVLPGRQGNIQAHHSPAARPGAFGQLPVYQNAPLLHVHDPKLPALQPVSARGEHLRQADAVIGDQEPESAVVLHDFDLHLRGPGMFGDVAQALLEHMVERPADVGAGRVSARQTFRVLRP